MKKEEIIYIASIVVGKGLGYVDMAYSDYLYGKEEYADDVWEYVDECQQIGRVAFKEKYADINLYPL